jgi:small multidrug resistance family-3 protein
MLSALSVAQAGGLGVAAGAGGSKPRSVWLLMLHPTASGRVYAAYGGVYVAVALLWLWRVDGVSPTAWDLAGVAVMLAGMGIVVWGGWSIVPDAHTR